MRACDVAVNLRHPTAGETSGTVIRLLGLGKPLIVNETGSFAEIPDDAAAKVPLDDTEEDLLLAYLRALAADEPLRRRMGENARLHMELHHGLAASARGYAGFLRETVAAGARAVPRRPAAPRLSGGRPAERSRPRRQRRDGGPRGRRRGRTICCASSRRRSSRSIWTAEAPSMACWLNAFRSRDPGFRPGAVS